MTSRFGRSAQYWFDLSRGIDDREVKPNRERKSIGAEDTFATDIDVLEDARASVAPLIEKVWKVCDARQLYGRTVTLKVKFADFEQITRSRSLPIFIRDPHVLGRAIEDLLSATFPPRMPVRLLGVTVSNFDRSSSSEAQNDQMTLPMQ